MASLTRWVLGHKRLVTGAWIVIAIAAFASIQPAERRALTAVHGPGPRGLRDQPRDHRPLRQRRRRRPDRPGRHAPGARPWTRQA